MTGGQVCPLSSGHLLIGGTTGSGKSVLINNLLYGLLRNKNCGVILIDPKGCELLEWSQFPQVWRHSDTVADCVRTLEDVARLMDRRFKEMKKKRQKETDRPPVYVFIDEWIDLKTQAGKRAELPLIRIIAKGRASRVFIVLATQRPTREIITGSIRANFPQAVALRCATPQESRNLIQVKGAELLPLVGFAYIRHPQAVAPELIKIDPPPTPEAIEELKKSLLKGSFLLPF